MAISIKKCPKCGHVRPPEETMSPECCPACGLFFGKWAMRDLVLSPHEQTPDVDDRDAAPFRTQYREQCGLSTSFQLAT
jgi:endogenous inhibitor of DNA gyrase (YacG/DUF329 family)